MIQIVRFILLSALIFLSVACTNPFTTRENQVEKPEVGTPGGSTVYDPAVNADIVFTNLKKAIREKNIDEYMKCFIPETQNGEVHAFEFVPEQHFINEFSKQPWTLNDERNYFIQLSQSQKNTYPKLDLSLNEGGTITLNPITPTSINDSLETASVKYQLTIMYSADSVKVYSGVLQFRLFKSTTPPEIWYIYYWQDNAINSRYDQCWTALKLLYRKRALRP